MTDAAKVQRVELDTLDGVPEALVSLFQEQDGKYVLEREDVAGLKSAHEKVTRERNKLRDQLKAGGASQSTLDKIDLDGDEYDLDTLRTLVAEHKRAKGGETMTKAEAEAERKRAIQAVKDEHVKQLRERDDALSARESELHRYIVHNGLRQFVQSADLGFKLQDGAADALIDHIEATKCFRVVDGKAVWWNGEGPKGTNGDGDPYGFREFVLERVKALPLLKVPSTGTGAHESDGRVRATNKPIAQMSEAEKNAAKKADPEAWAAKVAAEFNAGKYAPQKRVGVMGV